jgi:hypothetical protein
MDGSDCIPPPESCDQGSAVMSQVDTVHDCILPPVQLTPVCVTSVNRCAASTGVYTGCAFAPDGGVFIGGSASTDNNILTAPGWRFSEIWFGPPITDEEATEEESQRCTAAICFPPCPGVAPVNLLCAQTGAGDGGALDAADGGD